MATCKTAILVVLLALTFDAGSPDEGAAGCTQDGKFFLVGETLNVGPEPCNTYFCNSANTLTGLTCPMIFAGPNCEVVPGNLSAGSVYPHCCPTHACNENIVYVDAPTPKGGSET